MIERITIIHGDMREQLAQMDDCCFDAVVTDPPYHLTSIVKRFGADNAAPAQFGNDGRFARSSAGFMGKVWDGGDIAFRPETWAAVLRVMKPGAHLVAFGGSRTFHRMACAIEDAGFEIRDTLCWLYGSGFPKSHDVSKAIDRAVGFNRGTNPDTRNGPNTNPLTKSDKFGGYDDERQVNEIDLGPLSDAARQWEGWGTALKPAFEPIILARKPLSEKSVAANVLKHGVGALNIDACRVGTNGATKRSHQQAYGPEGRADQGGGQNWRTGHAIVKLNEGRWPANCVHDGSDDVLAGFPDAPGQQRSVGPEHGAKPSINVFGDYGPRDTFEPRGDSGSAARFFYTAKADSLDRLGSKHPTVKPVDLIQWLCRLICPPGGTILDCFSGSGTTGEAAFREGMRAVLIEREAEYVADIRRRMKLAMSGPDERKRESIKTRGKTADAGPLFGGS